MGDYISYDDLSSRMTSTKLASLGIVTGASLTAFINEVIDRAESYSNGFFGVLYTLPVPASPMVEEIVMRIAEYEMYKRGTGGDVPVKYKISFDEARKDLVDISKGIIIPPDTLTESLALKNRGGSSIDITTDTTLFTESDFSGAY